MGIVTKLFNQIKNMKLFACIAAVCAVPQRHLAPGLRDVEADGKPKWFVEDAGYPAQTSYDFEANANPNAKKMTDWQTALTFNLLCRGTPTDEFCQNGLEGVHGLIPSTFAKLFDLGRVDGDVLTETDDTQKPIYLELMNFQPDELKALAARRRRAHLSACATPPSWTASTTRGQWSTRCARNSWSRWWSRQWR